jgi:hypothetical protein
MITRDEMIGQLQEGMREIIFTKKDGNIRHMKCTLNPMLAPEILETKTSKDNLEVIPVWDIEKMGWRSFRVDSVLNFSEKQ